MKNILVLMLLLVVTKLNAQIETKTTQVNGVTYKIDYHINQFDHHEKSDKSMRTYRATMDIYKKIKGEFVLIKSGLKGWWNQNSTIEDIPEHWIRQSLK